MTVPLPMQSYDILEIGSKNDLILFPLRGVLRCDPSRFCPTGNEDVSVVYEFDVFNYPAVFL